jgi:hypothetical protein
MRASGRQVRVWAGQVGYRPPVTTPEDSFLGTLARRHYLPEGRSTNLPRWVLALYVATELLSVVVIAWTCVELVYDVDWARPESIALDAVASLVFVADWVVGLRYHAQTTLPADTSSKDRHRAGLYAAGSYGAASWAGPRVRGREG